MSTKKKVLLIVISILIVSLTTIASYAYFVAGVAGNANQNVVTSGTMRIEFTDGRAVNAKNFLPGQSITKTFKVKNTGTVQTMYDVYLSELINTFVDKSDLVYTLTSSNGCSSTTQVVVPSVSSKVISACSINANQEHEYTFTLTFKETNDNQDDNKGATFSAKFAINEFKDADLAMIDDVIVESETQFRVNNIRNTPNTDISNRTGNIYYVSNEGDDNNNGLSETSPFKTMDKLTTMFTNNLIPDGSTILFRDGDTFGGHLEIKGNDILVGSYGDITKGKPTLQRSLLDGAKDGEWVEYLPNIWGYKVNDSFNVFSNSVGTIWFFCNEGNDNCTKSMSTIDRKFEYAQLTTTNNDFDESLFETNPEMITLSDLEFYQAGHPYSSSATGAQLVLYSTSNPSERFDEIRFSVGGNIIHYSQTSDLKIDNLKIQFGGSHGIGGGSINNLEVTNCEIGFIGGSVQNYSSTTNKPTRFGNAIEIYGSVIPTNNRDVTTGFVVDNNYIYQCYDAGPTFQLTTDGLAHMEKAEFKNNVLEYNNYNIEYWMYSKATSGQNYNNSYIKDFTIDNNMMRYAGYGLCETRPDKTQASHIKTWGSGSESGARNHINGQIKITNNTFYHQYMYAYIFRSNKDNYPELMNNTFYGKVNDIFGLNSHAQTAPEIDFNDVQLGILFPNNYFKLVDKDTLQITNDSGTTGDLAWNYDASTYTLNITGSGAMADYTEENRAPWYKYRDYINTINIGEDVTTLGKWAFTDIGYLTTLRIDSTRLNDLSVDPSNVNYGNNYTLYEIGMKGKGTTLIFGPNVTRVPKMLMKPAPEYVTHSNITEIIFEGSNIKTISNYGLASFNGYGFAIPEGVTNIAGLSLGYGNARVIVLPDSLDKLPHYSMNGNKKLEKLVMGSSMSLIYTYAIGSAQSLKTLVIPHITDPSDIYSSTFNTTQLITVYGDESTEAWVNNLVSTYNKNLEYKPLSEYKINIMSNLDISGEVTYGESFTFNTAREVKVYYVYIDSNNQKHLFNEVNVERNNNNYTINNIKSDLYIELK